ncbi:uncharacterized protein F5Z01DRAFT_454109 [Emericellopsis atlantica]|uniref:Uncharacterized protein n=1 Tax=Emericellopsis atlantica TaxID=2614577 RepID=A0A9P7ZRQ8_9HYPO|nr:uncharacterized protein F5Z01DRAFT_454109 [Emericellopsis atlantica]KAG9257123.1 hypothetical protein F5Z01DRAFT_454109 [Emericellopsis atlantica]
MLIATEPLFEFGGDLLYWNMLLEASEGKVSIQTLRDSLEHRIGCMHSLLENSSFASQLLLGLSRSLVVYTISLTLFAALAWLQAVALGVLMRKRGDGVSASVCEASILDTGKPPAGHMGDVCPCHRKELTRARFCRQKRQALYDDLFLPMALERRNGALAVVSTLEFRRAGRAYLKHTVCRYVMEAVSAEMMKDEQITMTGLIRHME